MAEKIFLTEFTTSLSRIEQLVQERQSNNNQLMTLITDNITAIDAKVAELKGVSETVARQFQQFRGDLQACKDQSARQQEQIAECERALEQCANTKLAIQQELAALKQSSKTELDAKQNQIDQHEGTIRDLTAQIEPLRQQIEQLTREKAELQTRITELTTQNEEKDRIILEITEKDRQILELTNEVQAKTAQIVEITRLIDEKDTQIQELTAQADVKDTRILDLEINLAEVSAERDQKEQELVALRAENADFVARIIAATKVINDAMNLLDQMRLAKRDVDKTELARRFKSTTDQIQLISNSLQGIQGGGKKYKKTRKTKKIKKFRGGFTYGTSSSFRKNKNKSSTSSSLFNKHKKHTKKIYK
jgi:chromosome segregation ATPase